MSDLVYKKYTTSWVLEVSQTKIIITIFSANMQQCKLVGTILKVHHKGDLCIFFRQCYNLGNFYFTLHLFL